ncbi:MAG: DUF4270 family protein [Chitinophagaceae bacterium]
MNVKTTRTTVLLIVPLLCLMLSCERKQIDFGTVPENSYTHLIFIDSVGVNLSTVLIDSFSTGNATSYLIGKYKDPYLGLVKTQPFFQLNKPSSIPDISNLAVFDSLTCILQPNKYYYGDTTKQITVNVHELSQDIALSYNDLLYNTSKFDVKPTPLGSTTVTVRPNSGDSIFVRLDDAKGLELFSKLRSKDDQVSTLASFQNYFKGMSLTTGDGDTSSVYGIKDTVIMRVSYHYNDPFPVTNTIDFISLLNTEGFNQILTDRSGTGLVSTNRGINEIPSSATNHLSYSQAATGLYLKMTFPGLQGVLQTDNIVRLLKAELIIRPLYQSFDMGTLKLPSKLFLVQTDGTNLPSYSVTAPGGSGVQYIDPTLDQLYKRDNYYSFDVTNPISTMLANPGAGDGGFFAIQGFAGSTLQLDRIIAGDYTTSQPNYTTQLRLSVLVINK